MIRKVVVVTVAYLGRRVIAKAAKGLFKRVLSGSGKPAEKPLERNPKEM